MCEYVVIDGHSHKWDDLGDALRVLAQHYSRIIKAIVNYARGGAV